ncbi:MAG: hypothetical protein IJY44_01505 [Bacteroidaceae bacterium]|nr:hypothetical protein [Bacteroidaceae bacterium]
MKPILRPFVFILVAAMFAACENGNADGDGGDGGGAATSNGCYYALNSGLDASNSSLTRYDKNSGNVTQDYFFLQNNRGLGNLPNDMLVYGSKMYIAVSGEMTVEVTDLDAKSVKQIACGATHQPRCLAAAGGKVYVTYYDGYVARIDTATLEVESEVEVGRNPEQLAVVGNALYVANSGGLDWNTDKGYDKTVSVIDLGTFTETKKIEVAANPTVVHADGAGVYVISQGNYGDVPPALQYIDSEGTVTIPELCPKLSDMCYVSGAVYGLLQEYDALWNTINSYIYYNKVKNVAETSWIKDEVLPAKPYKLSAVGDAVAVTSGDYTSDGDVCLYDTDGMLLAKFAAGLYPVKVVKVD